jgi:hypothetical protein
MMAWVLVLAGVTAGDGGFRAGAASAEVGCTFEGRWVGTGYQAGTAPYAIADLGGGRLCLRTAGGLWVPPSRCTLIPEGQGRLRIEWGGGVPPSLGIYKVEGRHVYVCHGPAGRRPTSFRVTQDWGLWIITRTDQGK